MPIPVSIETLLEKNVVESSRIEFKAGWNPEKILHATCAFANDITDIGGGYIVVGVEEENGRPVLPPKGLDIDSLDGIQKKMLQLCQFTRPKYSPVYEPVVYMGKHLLLIWCPAGYDRPYRAAESPHAKKTRWLSYVRRASSTVTASDAELRELDEVGGFVPFDDRPNHRSSLSDLELSYMEEFLDRTESALLPLSSGENKRTLAESLRILGGPIEAEHPLNVGLMMFSSKPEIFFPYARIEVVLLPDPTGTGMTERTFSGPIDRQIRDSLQYIRNSVIGERVFKDPGRAEARRVANYPFAAIEEALTNAVYHRSYQIPEPITVRVEEGSLSVLSLPGPDRSISDDDLRRNRLISARYRNRRVGDFLKELHLVEGRNTGVPTMLRALRDNGNRPPLFETDQDRSFFRVTFFANDGFAQGAGEAKGSGQGRTVASPGRQSPLREAAKAAAILIARDGGKVTTGQLASIAGVSNQTAARALKELEGDGKLKLVGKSRTDPHQHYVLA